MKRKFALALSFAAVMSMVLMPASVWADSTASAADSKSSGGSFAAFGADLTEAQKATVLELLGISADDLSKYTCITVTNADEHKYLDSYLDSSVIGTKALSSCKVTPESSGHGITVETHNITYVTSGMYENALATAGMKNASVVVAGPVQISGTAALVGAMEAYAKMNGDVIQPQYLDGATDELVTTGKVAESVGDSSKAEQLIAAVKQIVAEKGYTSDSDIGSAIDDMAGQLNIKLSDEDRKLIIELMNKLSKLDLSSSDLAAQAKNIYNQIKSDGLDLSKYGISDSDVNSFLDVIGNFFAQILAWFQNLGK